MAYKSSDGKQFTNKPTMRAHEARLSSTQNKAKNLFPEHKPEPEIKESKKMSGGSSAVGTSGPVTCPNCGTTFEPSGGNPSAGDGVVPGQDDAAF